MENISIEQITTFSPNTVQAIRRLASELGTSHKSFTSQDLKDMLGSSGAYLFSAVDREKKLIIGMVTLIVYRIPFVKKSIVEDFIVDKAYRGQGIGTKLLQEVFDKASALGVSYIDFTSNPRRIESNKLYEKLGFKKRDTNVYRLVLSS